MTPLFNWNTKQIFIYLTAEYPGKSEGSSNKVTFWDKIITNKEDANLTLTNQRGKYSVWDVEKSFRGRNATVRLEWNIQPYVGPLILDLQKDSVNSNLLILKKKESTKTLDRNKGRVIHLCSRISLACVYFVHINVYVYVYIQIKIYKCCYIHDSMHCNVNYS